jgi:hypothetical protein
MAQNTTEAISGVLRASEIGLPDLATSCGHERAGLVLQADDEHHPCLVGPPGHTYHEPRRRESIEQMGRPANGEAELVPWLARLIDSWRLMYETYRIERIQSVRRTCDDGNRLAPRSRGRGSYRFRWLHP